MARIKKWFEKRYIGCFLAPALIILYGIAIYFTIALVYLALCNWNVKSPTPTFSGLQNFAAIFQDTHFWSSLGRTLIYIVATVSCEIVLGFIAAYAVVQISHVGVIRTLIITPMATTPVVVGLFWKVMLSPDFGPVNYFLGCIGIHNVTWLASNKTALGSIVLMNVWEWMPFSFLVITAGLQSIPLEICEAAMIDGASAWQSLVKVKIPMMKQLMLTLVILRIIDALKAFDLVFVTTQGGPGEATQVLPFYIYLKAFDWFNFGYAAALSVIVLIIANVISKVFIKYTGVNSFNEN